MLSKWAELGFEAETYTAYDGSFLLPLWQYGQNRTPVLEEDSPLKKESDHKYLNGNKPSFAFLFQLETMPDSWLTSRHLQSWYKWQLRQLRQW